MSQFFLQTLALKSLCVGLLIFPDILFQFSSVAQSCPTLCDPINRSTPGLPVHHHLPEFTQTHVHWVSDAIQPSHPLSSPSPPAPNPSQQQSLFQLFAWGGQSSGLSALASFLPKKSQGWSPSELTDWIPMAYSCWGLTENKIVQSNYPSTKKEKEKKSVFKD